MQVTTSLRKTSRLMSIFMWLKMTTKSRACTLLASVWRTNKMTSTSMSNLDLRLSFADTRTCTVKQQSLPTRPLVMLTLLAYVSFRRKRSSRTTKSSRFRWATTLSITTITSCVCQCLSTRDAFFKLFRRTKPATKPCLRLVVRWRRRIKSTSRRC